MGKIAVTGGFGMIGSYLQAELGSTCLPLDRNALDISDSKALESYIDSHNLDWVINCAGSVHGDELDLFKINSFYPLEMAKICAAKGVGFVYLSSARVFGKGSGPFLEDDIPQPYDSYGLSKFLGEQFVTRELYEGKYYIFRVSMTLGTLGHKSENQFLTRLMEKGKSGETVKAAVDSRTSVVHAKCVARNISNCILEDRPNGIYHIASSDCISSYDLTRNVFAKLGLKGSVLPAKVSDFSSFKPVLPSVQGLVSEKSASCGTCMDAVELFCAERKSG